MKKASGAKRFLTAIPLGVLAGLVCVFLASQKQPEILSFSNPLFWTILSDRFVLGVMVAMAGAYTVHPIIRIRCYPWLRGIVMGVLASLPLATGSFIVPNSAIDVWTVFWLTLLSGAVYGLIIDLIATKVGGEGKDIAE